MSTTTSGPVPSGRTAPTAAGAPAAEPTDPRSWSRPARAAAAGVLVLSPLLSAAGTLVAPASGDRGERLARVAEDPAPYELASALQLASLPFAAAAVVVVTLLTLAGSRRLAVVSGVLGVVGVIGHGVVAGIETMTDAAAAGGVDLAVLGVVDSELSGAPVVVAAILFIPVSVVGYLLRAIALWRSRAVPALVAALFAVWLPLELADLPYAAPALGVLVGAALAVVVLRRVPGRAERGPAAASGLTR